MTLAEFRATLLADHPPGVAPELRALWHAARGEWTEAHEIAQEIDTPIGAWIHAYLHRQEGDLGNAAYWYRRAHQPIATDALEDEWQRLAGRLVGTGI